MSSTPSRPAALSLRSIADFVAALSMIAASGAMIWAVLFRGGTIPPDHAAVGAFVSIDGAETQGAASAPVVVVEFVDFECPSCRTLATSVMPRLIETFVTPGSVQIAYRHFPLVEVHKQAFEAAVASYCAGRQGKFAQAHDALLQNGLEPNAVALTIGRIRGLDLRALAECQRVAGVGAVERDIADGRRLGVGGTPTILVAERTAATVAQVRHVIQGAQPIERIEAAIREVLSFTGR